jgi:murein DD-endopeptidase MepM/ murein hydrolase activator NlpD
MRFLAAAALAAWVGASVAVPVPAAPAERGHVFPVRGPHGERGPVGEFGAPRTGGRLHEGFDIVAACGTKLVSARIGKVLRRRYDPELMGNFVLIHARGTARNYLYAHLRRPAIVEPGEIVRTGQRIGGVGKTGNARTVGCHLHFEMRVRGRPVDPEPALRRWDSFS